MMKVALRTCVAHAAILLVLGVVLTALFPSMASAIPAWSRKYDTDCATCHHPAPPRLNTYGHKFRRAQYRMDDEFNQEPDWKKAGDYVSMRVRGRYEWADQETVAPASSIVTSTFAVHDATFFYAGPIHKNFSGFVELEWEKENEIKAVISIGGIRGTPDNFSTFRIGQFHTLTRVGWGGLDRPTGISTPSALSRPLVMGNAFSLTQDQVGLEGTWVRGNSRIIGQVLNGGDLGTAATTSRKDENRDKDYLLTYELMWGEVASGLSVFYYDGTQFDPDALVPPATIDTVDFSRYGITAVQAWDGGFEIQGGYIVGSDDSKLGSTLVSTIDGDGYWLQVQQYFANAKDMTIFGRFGSTDPNDTINDNERDQITLGVVWPVASWHLRWGLEYRNISQDMGPGLSLDEDQVVAELMLNF
jgi:hypothetical protein